MDGGAERTNFIYKSHNEREIPLVTTHSARLLSEGKQHLRLTVVRTVVQASLTAILFYDIVVL